MTGHAWHARGVGLGLMVVAMSAAVALGADDLKPVTAQVAVAQITREAMPSWKKDGTLPRQMCDFAVDKGWKTDRDGLVVVLGRKLNNDAAFEAYVKWQLLSFFPDFSDLTAAQLDQLIKGMAPMQPYPNSVSLVTDPGSSQPGNLINNLSGSVGGQRLGVDRRPKETTNKPLSNAEIVAATNERLTQQHAFAKASNVIVTRYRETLTERLPETGPARLTAMIEDLRTRVEAGDPSHVDLAKALLAASEKAKADKTLTAEQRKQLSDAVAVAAGRKWPIIKSVKLGGGGNITYDADYAVVDPNIAVQIRKNLLTTPKP
ncbi:MAG: hypothetical protein GC159_16450 [Phycisphaera sp.]|nr:hypothetical protein [Phycisphaera sp.]